MSLHELRNLTQAATRPGLHFGLAVFGETGDLHKAELASIARARPKRRAEFLAGRCAARRALTGLGLGHASVPADFSRAPVWPDGVTGSISHASGLAVAVVAETSQTRALGVDLEGNTPLKPELIPEILRHDEPLDPPDGEPGASAIRVFSAKEAVYKALYPELRMIFGFHGLHVTPSDNIARLVDHPETREIPDSVKDAPLPYAQWLGDRLILSLCALPSDV